MKMIISQVGNNLTDEIEQQMIAYQATIAQMKMQIDSNRSTKIEIMDGATLEKNGCVLSYDGISCFIIYVDQECLDDEISDWNNAMELFAKHSKR